VFNLLLLIIWTTLSPLLSLRTRCYSITRLSLRSRCHQGLLKLPYSSPSTALACLSLAVLFHCSPWVWPRFHFPTPYRHTQYLPPRFSLFLSVRSSRLLSPNNPQCIAKPHLNSKSITLILQGMQRRGHSQGVGLDLVLAWHRVEYKANWISVRRTYPAR